MTPFLQEIAQGHNLQGARGSWCCAYAICVSGPMQLVCSKLDQGRITPGFGVKNIALQFGIPMTDPAQESKCGGKKAHLQRVPLQLTIPGNTIVLHTGVLRLHQTIEQHDHESSPGLHRVMAMGKTPNQLRLASSILPADHCAGPSHPTLCFLICR